MRDNCVMTKRVHRSDIPLTHSSGFQFYFSIFTVNLAGTFSPLQHKVNLYIMAGSCLTSSESQPGARCRKVPELVKCNVLHTAPFATALLILL